ncbi:MAG: metal ABC transporter substrate-binding protein [Vulcanimicrobiaceae bacterium]
MRAMPVKSRAAVACLSLALLTACGTPGPAAGSPPIVVTTMSTLASLVQSVGKTRVRVINLVPVGVSPENYQPTPRDISTVASASALIENGAGIEGWLNRTIQSAKNPSLRITVCTDGLPVVDGNPHLWMNPAYASIYVQRIASALTQADPGGRAVYARNAASEKQALNRLDRWIASRIATIPPAQRNMIVFHDAWMYYNRRYGLKTVGAIELSPGQDPSPQYIGKLIALAKHNHVRAVFAEPEYSPKLAKTLASEAGIAIVTNLYDDSLATQGPVRNYDAMLRYDTETIVRALR